MAKIGFIGLDQLGLAMAKNLIKAGHSLKGYDPSKKNREAAKEAGIVPVNSAGQAAKGVEVVIALIPDPKKARGAFLDDNGIISNADKGTLLIDCSNLYAATSRDIHEIASEKGISIIDAPFSGDIEEAGEGDLSFMVRGGDKAFLEGETILEPMAEKIIHYGPFGKQTRKKSSDPKTKVVYKKGSPWWRRSTAILVLLFLGGNAVFFALIEESIKMEGQNLTVSLELGDTERKIFCRGSRMIGLEIDGC